MNIIYMTMCVSPYLPCVPPQMFIPYILHGYIVRGECYYHIFISIYINIIPGFPVTAILNTSVTVHFPNWIHNFTDHIILMFSISLPIYYHFHLQLPYLPQLIFTVVSGLHFSSTVHISDCLHGTF